MTEFSEVLTQMANAVESFESNSDGYVDEKYLANDVIDGLGKVEETTIELTDEANGIIESVQDLVNVDKIDESDVMESVKQGRTKTNEVIGELHALDESQVEALLPVRERLDTMKAFLSELDSKFKRAELSVISYDVNAVKDIGPFSEVTNRFFTYDEDVEARLFKDDPAYQLERALDTVKSGASMVGEAKVEEKNFLETAFDTTANVGKGIVTGAVDVVSDTVTGVYDMVTNPVSTIESIGYMVTHPVDTGKYMANAITESFNRDVLNGDARSAAHWITYAAGTIAGTKGASTAIKSTKAGSSAAKAAKQGVQHVANKAGNIELPNLSPFNPQHQLSPIGSVPYNVVDSFNLRNQMLMSAKRMSNDKPSQYGKGTGKRKNDDDFIGTLKGEKVHLNGVKVKEIIYTKRPPKETAKLRKKFNSSIRKNFLKEFANDPVKAGYLRKAGLNEGDIARMKDGLNPKGWQVHHNLPLDDGGTNDFTNLILIKNDPYHKAVTNEQNSLARGLAPQQSKTIHWPMFEDGVYPSKPFNRKGE